MKKKKSFVWAMVIGCILCLSAGCNKENTVVDDNQINSGLNEVKDEKVEKDEKDDTEKVNQEETDKVITWTIPNQMDPTIIETNISRVNAKLKEDGYDFMLQIKTFPRRTYREDVVALLESGEADIVSVGADSADGSRGYAQEFLRKGYLEELSEYLNSEEGRFLKEWHHEDEWKRVEIDGKLYVLPSQNNVYGADYFAFNKTYVTEDMLKDFSGTPGELIKLLSSVKKPEGVYEILATRWSMDTLCAVSGVTEEQGVFFDLVSGTAENPFSNQIFYQHVKDMNTLYLNGRIKIFQGIDALDLERQVVRNGDFVVWMGHRKDEFYEEVKDSVYIVPRKRAMVNALSSTSGINKNSPEKEEALQLLTLFYTNETYANLLLFGEEGTDYQLIDGYVCDMEGERDSNSSRSWTFGTLDTAYPCSGDFIVVEKNATQDAFFASEYYLDSAILGFQPDSTTFSADMKKARMIFDNYYEIWKEEDLESAWQKAAEEFETSGGKELVEELNRQVTQWMGETSRK